MKALILTFSFALSTLAFAQHFEMQTGTFNMYEEIEPNRSCAKGVTLTLDKAKITNEVALLKNHVLGLCEIYFAPNPRFINLKASQDRCGSTVMYGELVEYDGTKYIKIIDHRTRLCRDIQPAKVIMITQSANGDERIMYSLD